MIPALCWSSGTVCSAPSNRGINKFLGHYEIGCRLGRGGSSIVFACRDRERPELPLAAKVLRAGRRDRGALSRFCQEFLSGHRLRHVRIVGYEDFVLGQSSAAIIMARALGGTLRELIDRKPLSLADALRITSEILEGLIVVHEHNILHRDLKPENILLTASESALLSDFSASQSGANTLANTAEFVGSLLFAAPEQLYRGAASPRSDTYAVGMILWELLTGGHPIKGPAELLRRLDAGMFSMIDVELRQRRDLPLTLRSLLARTLACDPAHRWSTAGELRAALERYRQQAPPELLSLCFWPAP